jgi:hypothetical protein
MKIKTLAHHVPEDVLRNVLANVLFEPPYKIIYSAPQANADKEHHKIEEYFVPKCCPDPCALVF